MCTCPDGELKDACESLMFDLPSLRLIFRETEPTIKRSRIGRIISDKSVHVRHCLAFFKDGTCWQRRHYARSGLLIVVDGDGLNTVGHAAGLAGHANTLSIATDSGSSSEIERESRVDRDSMTPDGFPHGLFL